MPNRNKQRGYELEKELVDKALAWGLQAERAWGSDGRAIGETSGVDLKVAGHKIQAKRVKRISARYKPPVGAESVAFREDRGKTYIMVPYETLLALLGGRNPKDNDGQNSEITTAGEERTATGELRAMREAAADVPEALPHQGLR